MGSIYLIRHGQASFGAADYDVLSATGIRQAEHLAGHFAGLRQGFDRCVSGSLRRQLHTARTVIDGLNQAGLPAPEPEVDAAFDEFDAEGVIRSLLPALLPEEPEALHILQNAAQHRTEFQRLFALIIARWISGEYDSSGQQSWLGFVQGVQDGLQRLLAQAEAGQRIAVFTSGGTITALLHVLTGMPARQAFELNWHIVNTSVHQLKYNDQGVSLASFNNYSHLQLLNQPELITYR